MAKTNKKRRRAPRWWKGDGKLPESQGAEADERMAVMTSDLLTRLAMAQNRAERLAPVPVKPKPVLAVMPPLFRRRRKTTPPPTAA